MTIRPPLTGGFSCLCAILTINLNDAIRESTSLQSDALASA